MENRHNDQQREEQHRVDGVFRAPLDAQVFDEMGPEGAGHLWPSVVGRLDQVGSLDFYIESLGRAQVVVRAENKL